MDLWNLLFTLALVCANDSFSASDGKFYDTSLCLYVCTYIYSFIERVFLFYMCQVYASSLTALSWVHNVKSEKYVS